MQSTSSQDLRDRSKNDEWRMIASLGKVGTAGAIDTAMRAGWIDLEGGHSVRLVDQGQ
jgi:hypothetical protein